MNACDRWRCSDGAGWETSRSLKVPQRLAPRSCSFLFLLWLCVAVHFPVRRLFPWQNRMATSSSRLVLLAQRQRQGLPSCHQSLGWVSQRSDLGHTLLYEHVAVDCHCLGTCPGLVPQAQDRCRSPRAVWRKVSQQVIKKTEVRGVAQREKALVQCA